MIFDFSILDFAVDVVLSNDWSWWGVVEGLTCSGIMNILVIEAILFNLYFVGASTTTCTFDTYGQEAKLPSIFME